MIIIHAGNGGGKPVTPKKQDKKPKKMTLILTLFYTTC